MGDRKTQTLRGFLVPDTALSFANLDTAASSYTQAGERPGTAVGTDSRSRLLPLVSGEQGIDLDVRVGRAGYPATQPKKAGGLLVKEDGASDWLGWNGWSTIERSGKLENASNRGDVLDQAPYRYGPFAGQKVLAVAGFYKTTAEPESYTYDADNPSQYWAANGDIVTDGVSKFWDVSVTQLPDGRFIAIVGIENTTSTQTDWSVYSTDDDGVTWTLYDTDPFSLNGDLPDTLNNDPSFTYPNTKSLIRAFPDGSVVFVRFQEVTAAAAPISRQYTQWASKGLGSAFVEVSSWVEPSPGTSPYFDFGIDVTNDGRLLFVHASEGSTTDTLEAVVLGGAFDPIGSASRTQITTLGHMRVAVCITHTGAMLVLGSTTSGQNYRYESNDGGSSWAEIDLDSSAFGGGFPYFGGSTGFRPASLSFAPVGSGVSFVYSCQDGSAPVSEDEQVFYMLLGGWSSIEYKTGHMVGILSERSTATYVPVGLPGGCTDWTASGTGTEATGNDGLLTVSTSSAIRSYRAPTNANQSDALLTAFVEVVSGGSSTAPVIGMRAISNDGGTNVFGIYLNFTSAGYSIYDYWPGTSIVSVSRSMAAQVQVLIWVSGVDGSYIVADRTLGEYEWTIRSTGTATGSGIGGSTQMDWGNIQTGTGVSDWGPVQATYTRQAVSVGALEPATGVSTAPLLRGLPMSTNPAMIPGASTSAGASSLSVEGGPGRVGETWDVVRDYDYPARAMFPEVDPSPSRTWRSSSIAVQDFVWDLTDDHPLADGSGSIAVYIDGATIGEGSLAGWNGAAWVDLIKIEMQDGSFPSLTLVGDTMTAANDLGSRYFWRGELDGGWMSRGGNEYTITKQTEGRLAAGVTTKQATIRIENPPAAGTASAETYWPRALFVAHNVASYSKYRLRIDAFATPTGYLEIGTLMIGAFVPAGRQWSLGTTISTEPNVTTSRNKYGTARRSQNGPPRRTVSINWSDPANLYPHRQADADPDYLSANAGDPLAAYNDVPYWLHGVFADLDSGSTPVVLCTSVPSVEATITDPTTFVYGHLTRVGDLTIRLGDDEIGEVIGVGSTVIEEIV